MMMNLPPPTLEEAVLLLLCIPLPLRQPIKGIARHTERLVKVISAEVLLFHRRIEIVREVALRQNVSELKLFEFTRRRPRSFLR